MDFKIRPMHLEDVSQVAEIERDAFPTTWPPTPLKKELSNRLAGYLVAWSEWTEQAEGDPQPDGTSNSTTGLQLPKPWVRQLLSNVRNLFVTPSDTTNGWREFIVGYVGTWFMVDDAHIVSIAVRQDYRRLGLGELLLIGAAEMAMLRRSQRLTLEVRVSNFPAHALYEKYGFHKVGVRKRYYADNHEDAVIMTTDAIHTTEYQEMFRDRVDAFCQRRGEAIRTLA